MLPTHPIVYLFIPRPKIFEGMPDDQIRSELVRIMHTIDTCTGYIGGDFAWWYDQLCQYFESDVGHNFLMLMFCQ